MLNLTTVDITKEKVGTLVIPVCEDKEIHKQKTVIKLVKEAKRLTGFKGSSKEEVTLYRPSGTKIHRVILFGLGQLKKTEGESLRISAGEAVKHCIKKGLSQIVIAVPAPEILKMELCELIEALGEGSVLGNHLFDKYKKEKKLKPLASIRLLVQPSAVEANEPLVSRVETICQGTILARDWVSMPSNDKKPDQFARSITQIAEKEKLNITVMDEKSLKRNKFGALLAVGAGSRSKPCMVILEYRPAGAKKTIALVGKGVTFDSGGINLKPSGSLDHMKSDMSGAAAVAATLITLARLKSKTRVVGLMPIVENMPSATATRPGDIVTSFDGRTIEIANTDAEGRLILVDAISYAIKTYKPHVLIDLATLTGACMVALGQRIAGAFTMDEELAQIISKASERTHERCWRLPLPEDYKEMLKSDFADLRNIGDSRWGGAITAALFLSEFVDGTRWAHLDIAGPSYIKKQSAYCGAGGTGFGVRLLCRMLEMLSVS
ncbi:MAG: leucyl aminopeptidase [Deltaproteobacteria bacterium]|nr:leucyl aminopeptidase [Deltaproteobacteria bacterium]MBW2153004.1 leucyl aminopeptidase [Deltaproteobacteria bacterium]